MFIRISTDSIEAQGGEEEKLEVEPVLPGAALKQVVVVIDRPVAEAVDRRSSGPQAAVSLLLGGKIGGLSFPGSWTVVI